MVTNIVVTKTTTFGGSLLVVVGLLGFVTPGLMGMHLSVLHKAVYLLSGATAIYFGLKATPVVARAFCLVFGMLYGLLGLAGLVAGTRNYTLTIVPGALILGPMDHLFHLILGATFLVVGWFERAAATLATR